MEQDRLVSQVLQPVWVAWLNAVALGRIIRMPRGYLDSPRSWQRCEWRSHAWSYPNPLQEAQTKKILVDEGFTSRSAVVAEMGWDVEDVDQQNADDQARERALGLSYGKDPAPIQQQDTVQP
jgi:capsid protein